MKYTFEAGNPYGRDSASHHQVRCGADIYRKGPGVEQPGAAPYVTANGPLTSVAKYRADRITAALTATRDMILNDLRRLAGSTNTPRRGGLVPQRARGEPRNLDNPIDRVAGDGLVVT